MKIDETKWNEIRAFVIERDKTCRIWNILLESEKEYIFQHFREDYRYLSTFLDCAHVYPKSVKKNLYYDPNYIVLISKFFHYRLDSYRHPVTSKSITRDEKLEWFYIARNWNTENK